MNSPVPTQISSYANDHLAKVTPGKVDNGQAVPALSGAKAQISAITPTFTDATVLIGIQQAVGH
ncbi:hypothetical protein [Streptomyces sp. CT34]|uniref:hypothetical protein n=1 Tax=Streptomyces sp. CT34 TaxID=1553907 RepID=UPI0005BD7322|nr:hypothetical protein [Streptomyces sp. CT34]